MNQIKFSCPQCGQHINAPSELADTANACPTCQATIRVPRLPDSLPQTFTSPTCYCVSCGGSIAVEDRFCRYCGRTTDEAVHSGGEFQNATPKEHRLASDRIPTEIVPRPSLPSRSAPTTAPQHSAPMPSKMTATSESGYADVTSAAPPPKRGVIGRSVAGWILLTLQWAALYSGGGPKGGHIIHALGNGNLGGAIGGFIGGSLLALFALILGLRIGGHSAGHALTAAASITIALVFFLM